MDISRSLAGDPSGGTGWVNVSQAGYTGANPPPPPPPSSPLSVTLSPASADIGAAVNVQATSSDPSYTTIRVTQPCGSPRIYEIGAPQANFTWSTDGCDPGTTVVRAEARTGGDTNWSSPLSTTAQMAFSGSRDWEAQYFGDTNLSSQCASGGVSGLYMFRSWGEDGPPGCSVRDNWSARFTRRISLPGGNYTFALNSDDWGRLWVNGDLVVDNWQGRGQHYESRNLSGGNYEIRVEYADTLGSAKLSAWWRGPGFDLPQDVQDPNCWFVQYWGNTELWWDSVARAKECTSTFSHDWGASPPISSLPSDRFSGRAEKSAPFEAGWTRFHMRSDDGGRLWIDGVLYSDAWQSQSGTEISVDVRLTAGVHTVRYEFVDYGGNASARVWWDPAVAEPPSAGGVCDGGTLAYWDMTEGSGNTIRDQCNGYNGSWNQGVAWASDAEGPYLRFSGGDGQRIRIAQSALSSNTSTTVEMRMKAGANSGPQRVLSQMAPNALRFTLDYSGSRLNVWGATGDGQSNFCGSHSCLTGDRWTHVAFQIDGTLVRLYYDGQLVKTTTLPFPQTLRPTGAPTEIGNGEAIYGFDGKIQYIRISSGVRNDFLLTRLGTPPTATSTPTPTSSPTQSTPAPAPTQTQTPTPASTSCPVGQWRAEYFNNRTLSGNPALVRCEASIDYDWGGNGPGGGIGIDNFSVRWTGNHDLTAGSYTFIARADDGVRLFVNGGQVIDAWRDQGPTEYRENRVLSTARHEIKVEYYESGGGAVAQARWELLAATSTPTPVVTTCPDGQWRAEYFNNRGLSGSPALVRCEASINADWGGNGPVSGVGVDNFSVRWTGYHSFAAGDHTFVARADDGVRLYVDGATVIDAWRDQGPTEFRQNRSMSAGRHEIKVEYYEAGGGAVAQAHWEQVVSTLTPTPTSTSTPTPTSAAPVPTATATRTATPVGVGPLLFDDFSNGMTGWWRNNTNVNAVPSNGGTVLRFTPSAGSDTEASKSASGVSLAAYQTVELKINLNGATLLGGDASALYLNQGGWRYVSLSNYVQQGSSQMQTIRIPLSAFSGFNKTQSFSNVGIRIWVSAASTIDIDDIRFLP